MIPRSRGNLFSFGEIVTYRHQGIHGRMGMHRMRRKGVEGAPGLVVEREGEIGNGCGVFGLWRVRFPPCLVRPGRRLPVQGLSEGSLGFRDRLPAQRGPGTGAVPGLPEIKEKSGIWNLVPVE